MDFLSPAKLLVILVVALAVLGPDKLPTLAKQVGSLWRDFSKFRQKLESDVRGSFPDLPSTETITHAVRSPLSFLDTLADAPGPADGTGSASASGDTGTTGSATRSPEVEGPVEFDPSAGATWPADTVTASEVSAPVVPEPVGPAERVVHEVRSFAGTAPDDPGSN
jgi:Sec-independent protein translocase protein TatA